MVRLVHILTGRKLVMQILPILLLVALLAGCNAQTPSGPTTNVNGNDNTTIVGGSGQDSKVGDTSNPKPVIPPVVINNPPAAAE